MADSGLPNALGRIWQRGTSGWTGNWTVYLDDGPHAVSTMLKMGLTGNRLTVFVDGQKIDSALIFAYLGEIRRFTWRGHAFALRVKGLGMSGELALSMHGSDITPDAEAPSGIAPNDRVPAPDAARMPQAPHFQREVEDRK